MTVKSEIVTSQLADLVKQVQAGNEVLLTQGNKTVAKLVAVHKAETDKANIPLRVRSLKGHRVLTPIISQAEIAEDFLRP